MESARHRTIKLSGVGVVAQRLELTCYDTDLPVFLIVVVVLNS